MNKKYLVFMFGFCASTLAQAKTLAPSPEKLAQGQADETVAIFMNACVSTQAQPNLIAAYVAKNGLHEVTSEQARQIFLMKSLPGMVWIHQSSIGQYILTSQAGKTCNVFARNASGGFARKALESWLPPKNTGFSVTTTSTPERVEGLATRGYKIDLNSRPYADWVFSSTNRTDGIYQVAITYLAR